MLPLLPMRPRYLEKIWGGARIAALPGKRAHPPPPTKVGEAWEVADLPEGSSTVAEGPLAGRTLAEIGRADGENLRGRFHVDRRFPLLVKLIDASDDLSVQVHPDAAWAAAHPGTFSKDEAWLMVEADQGARILHGFTDGVDPAAFRASIAEQRADALLRAVVMAPGDVVHVPPGTVHAIGRGLLVLEVQEPSDTTFRVYDYGRLEHGRPRALHVDQALEVATFGPQPPPRCAARPLPGGDGVEREELVRSRAFVMERWQLAAGTRTALELPPDAPGVLFALDGAVDVSAEESACALETGASLVVPACRRRAVLAARGGTASVVAMFPAG
ncbi:MAG: class I mannose-6-phosphate isomerase [Deltaproteobacteria bacterium]|nr:class I mannose-6-phosphate isomerase [Deltaproteobacteria bacterium]